MTTTQDLVRAIAEALRSQGPGLLDAVVVSTTTHRGGIVVVHVQDQEFLVQVQEIIRKEGAA